MPYIYHITGCVSAILPGATEYMMTGQLTPFIAGGVGVAGGLLTYAILAWWHKRRHPAPEVPVVPDADRTPEIEVALDEDEELVKQNPGHHAAVIRLIVKTETVEAVDSLFDNYINSASHHKAHEIDVVTIHYLKKAQLLRGQERHNWYGRRNEVIRQYGYTKDRFMQAMDDAWKKYPELADWD